MLVSSKWETVWMESRHCSKSVINVPLASQQAKKLLEDLKTSCCSPNKAVQLEALKCWEIWINSQNLDDWKQNAVCYTAVGPLIIKKLQPLIKDVDICKLKLSLMWGLLVKVQNIINLEGPQYILEVFMQSCMICLSSADGMDHEISILVFQLLLALFEADSELINCDKKMFPMLSIKILQSKKVFHCFADKFLTMFLNWRKVRNKNVIIQLWKCFLEQCEFTCEYIPIPIWHKVFKIAAQVCSEANESLKDRLAFLHGCVTTLKSVLTSSKFIDYGNSLTTPCEALLKKLIELCTTECDEDSNFEMFCLSQEISKVLGCKNVTVGGYDLCISILDELEEFSHKSLFWGVWCGLVYCYKVNLMDLDQKQFTKLQNKFYRKLRGVAVNFDLDKNYLHINSVLEVEKHISYLKISCLCASVPQGMKPSNEIIKETRDEIIKETSDEVIKETNDEIVESSKCVGEQIEKMDVEVEKFVEPKIEKCEATKEVVQFTQKNGSNFGKFISNDLFNRISLNEKVLQFKFDLFKNIHVVDLYVKKSLIGNLFYSPLIMFKRIPQNGLISKAILEKPLSLTDSLKDIQMEITITEKSEKTSPTVSCVVTNEISSKKNAIVPYKIRRKSFEQKLVESALKTNKVSTPKGKIQIEDVTDIENEVIASPKTRSKRRAEEEQIKKEEEGLQKRRRRKSYEVIVQEIVRKNRLRKSQKVESDGKRKKSPVSQKKDRQKKTKLNVSDENEKPKKCEVENVSGGAEKSETSKNKKKVGDKSMPNAVGGKMEDYFKVISKDASFYEKKEIKNCCCLSSKKRKNKLSEVTCSCIENAKNDKKNEVGWRQTSLKTMMNEKIKSKREKVKNKVEAQKAVEDVEDEKFDSERKEITDNTPEFKLIRFDEVLRDHEYAKKAEVEIPSNIVAKIEEVVESKVEMVEEQAENIPVDDKVNELKTADKENVNSESLHNSTVNEDDDKISLEKVFIENLNLSPIIKHDTKDLVPKESVEKESETDVEIIKDDGYVENVADDIEDSQKFSLRLGRKRIRMLDSLKPSKKLKLESTEENPVSIDVENGKENPAEISLIFSPTKMTAPEKSNQVPLKEKIDVSPTAKSKTLTTPTGTTFSRALKMISLVPESVKPGKMNWDSPRFKESQPKMEIKAQGKKSPNVDIYSRASRMLALLSEIIPKETDEQFMLEDTRKEIICNETKELDITPNMKMSLSNSKSPVSAKKKKFIRFDDTKNETVLYQTHTPPSQILEEREKRRRIKQ